MSRREKEREKVIGGNSFVNSVDRRAFFPHFELSDLVRSIRPMLLCASLNERGTAKSQREREGPLIRSIRYHTEWADNCAAAVFVLCRGQCQLPRNRAEQREKSGRNTKENGGSWENLAKSRETRSIIHPTQDWEDVNVCDGSPLVNTQPRRASERERVRVLWCCVRPMREKEKKKTSGIYWGRPLRPKQQHTHTKKKAISPPKKKERKTTWR